MVAKVIAIVENEDSLCLFIQVLKLNGFRICEFFSSEKALSYITKNSEEYDLIISDYRLSINVNELCTKLLISNSSLNIILMSAFQYRDYNPTFKFIGKPIPISKLINVVKESLDENKTLV